MICTKRYEAPLGEILLAGNGEGLTGLWFAGQKYIDDCYTYALERLQAEIRMGDA